MEVAISRKVCLNGTVQLFTIRLLQDLFDFIYRNACLYDFCIDKVRKLEVRLLFQQFWMERSQSNSQLLLYDFVFVLNSLLYMGCEWASHVHGINCDSDWQQVMDHYQLLTGLCPTRIDICVKIPFLQHKCDLSTIVLLNQLSRRKNIRSNPNFAFFVLKIY